MNLAVCGGRVPDVSRYPRCKEKEWTYGFNI